MDQCQVKVRKYSDHRKWEDIPCLVNQLAQGKNNTWFNCKLVTQENLWVTLEYNNVNFTNLKEVRVNTVGSQQGHYYSK